MSEKNSVVAIFETHSQAEDAVRELQKDGFDMKKLSIVGKDYHTDEHVVGYYNTGDRMMYWGKLGAFWGGFWGLLFGSAFFWVPGIGPLVVAGPLVTWIVAALEGAVVTGGLTALGAGLSSIGIPENSIVQYETEVKSGKLLLVAHGTADEVQRASDLLHQTWSGDSNGPCPAGRSRRVTMAMEDQHDHGHRHGPPRRKLHHDWRLWLVVGLMLVAMLMYVLSDNERFGLGRGTGKISPPVPAMP